MKQQRKIHIKPSYIILGVILILLAAFCIRVAVWEHNYFARMEGSERASSGAYIDGQDVDEEKPDSTAIAEYKVAPDKPRYLTISSLGIINARIVEVGLKENQELATPVNIYDIGWYTGSDLPGTGVSVMDAHGGNAGQGIFRTLPNIQTGAEISVEMGDGRLYTYVVTDTATKALGDDANAYMNTAFTSPEPGIPSLTLITCTGDWWLQSQTYSHRFFVRALLKTEPTE